MPVLLQPHQFDHWLSGEMTVEELKPVPNDYLQRWTVRPARLVRGAMWSSPPPSLRGRASVAGTSGSSLSASARAHAAQPSNSRLLDLDTAARRAWTKRE
jgi:hypothetical protein